MISHEKARNMLVDYENVRSSLATGLPRQHGNGFFQLDLKTGYRLHVWDPTAPRAQSVRTPIHDHRFSFESLILFGTQRHFEYRVIPTPEKNLSTHKIYEAKPRVRQDTLLTPTGVSVEASVSRRLYVPAGQVYSFQQHKFHETPVNEYVVTLLKKTKEDPNHAPRVLVPAGTEPDNDFTRYDMPTEHIWAIINEAVTKVVTFPWSF